MPVQNVGTYTITSEYSGFGGVYLASTSGSTSYTVNKASTSITAPAGFTNNFGTAVTSSTTLTTGGVAFANQTVVFQSSIDAGVNWSTIASRTTDANGDASVTWTPGNSNTDRVRAVHNGSTNYNSSTSSAGTIYLRTLKAGTFTPASIARNDFAWYGCNVNVAEAVSSRFTMPSPAGAVDMNVTGVTVEVSGGNGESANVRLCVWEYTNAAGTYTGTLIGAGPSITPRNRTLGQANIEAQSSAVSGAVRPGGSYMAGFWRNDGNCAYTTQYSFDNNTGTEVYEDSSHSSPQTFNRSRTIAATGSLIFSVDYSYWS
jgi:hypothetical protein